MKKKTLNCFVIMPISDQDGYEKGHFSRVYEHIIKPACEKAGFIPKRADNEVKTNYIVIDIIRKILDSDIVICDLSARNPNVLYELGLRQAFNKKALLIKDIKTDRIFDIQGLRTIDYDESLRVDSVEKNINSIAKSLTETYEADENDVNSLIQLLAIKPAVINDTFELSGDTSIILEALRDIQSRMSTLEVLTKPIMLKGMKRNKFTINKKVFTIGEFIFKNNEYVGELLNVMDNWLVVKTNKEDIIHIRFDEPLFNEIDCQELPF